MDELIGTAFEAENKHSLPAQLNEQEETYRVSGAANTHNLVGVCESFHLTGVRNVLEAFQIAPSQDGITDMRAIRETEHARCVPLASIDEMTSTTKEAAHPTHEYTKTRIVREEATDLKELTELTELTTAPTVASAILPVAAASMVAKLAAAIADMVAMPHDASVAAVVTMAAAVVFAMAVVVVMPASAAFLLAVAALLAMAPVAQVAADVTHDEKHILNHGFGSLECQVTD